MAEREETTLDEVIFRARAGIFYDDYDWANGPALRALDRAKSALEGISSTAVCLGIVSTDELPTMVEGIYKTAEEGLGR